MHGRGDNTRMIRRTEDMGLNLSQPARRWRVAGRESKDVMRKHHIQEINKHTHTQSGIWYVQHSLTNKKKKGNM